MTMTKQRVVNVLIIPYTTQPKTFFTAHFGTLETPQVSRPGRKHVWKLVQLEETTSMASEFCPVVGSCRASPFYYG